jgi:hypothetical protein
MRFATLDGIVRSALMQKGFSLHWYLQALKSASDCLRELTFDSLKNVNTVVIPVSSTGTIDLPCDFVDMIKVGVKTGQYIKPLVKKDSINRLQNKDSSGTPIVYPDPTSVDLTYVPFLLESDYYNDNYEALGRFFGFRADWLTDGYKVLRERGQIQLEQGIADTEIYLEYISDGQCSDNATMIHPYAQKTIEAYIFWQFKEHSRAYGAGERQLAQREFDAQRRILRARLNGLTKDDYIRIVRSGYSATIKG